MKKVLFYIAVALSAIGCSDDNLVNHQKIEHEYMNKLRSAEDAVNIARDILSSNYESRTNNVTISSVHTILSDQSRSSKPDTLIYAVDIENNGGFILIAAPKNVEPVLAIIDQGAYNDPENIENKVYQQTLSQLLQTVATQKEDISNLPITPGGPFDPILKPYEYWDTVKIKEVFLPTPIETAWNQRWPENIYSPNGIAGCVPVAIAQILTYFESPKSISYSYPDHDINNETLNWSEIKKHKRSSKYGLHECVDCTATPNTHSTIGRLIREIGYIATSDYNPGSTQTQVFYIPSTFNELIGISPIQTQTTPQRLYEKLKAKEGVALVVSAGNDSSNKAVSHAWVADATNTTRLNITHYVYNPTAKDYDIVEQVYEEIKLIHYNWGWGGNCNGYFNVSVLNPANATKYDYSDMSNRGTVEFKTDKFYFFYLEK